MAETKLEITKRKIRNGKRKQAEAIQREKDKMWHRLKDKKPRLLTAKWEIEWSSDIIHQLNEKTKNRPY